MALSGEPASLIDIAGRRSRHDPSTPYLLTIDEQPPYDVVTRTYGEVLERAASLARRLADSGVKPGDRVGCYLPNSPSWVVASLAVWLNRGAVAAVGTLLPAVEAARLFELAEVETVVTVDTVAPPEGFDCVVVDAEGALPGVESSRTDGAEIPSSPLPDEADLAVAIFTSGTTGRPKGITHSHGDLVLSARSVASAYARNSDFRPTPAPPHLPPGVIFNPFGHMAGYNRLGFRMWIGRPTLIVPKFTVAAVGALLDRFEMDALQLTPTMIHMLAHAEEELDLGGVKYATSGTAPLPTATRETFEKRYGVPIMQAYGMSEVGAVSQERYEDVVAGRRGPGSVGRIAAGVEVQIRPVDDDRPDGEGEILVRTDELADEFVDGTRVPVDADGWFATGDVGRLDDGILYITGRVQEKLIVGGFNVYPAEVEEVARCSDLVREAVVVGVPDDRLGERPVAGIVWEGAPDEDVLLEYLRAELAHYKVPRSIFDLEALPLTPRDKVDRSRATELALAALGQSGEDRTEPRR